MACVHMSNLGYSQHSHAESSLALIRILKLLIWLDLWPEK